ncbi:MAG: glycosyltransferase family 4 protein [Palaeococcus sp.]|uniref:glycosyltransferase family 4 protein n=1 Tax=Palaeococcus sp. (in: euryarchaeotes) TaxID=2820298 RepID=UPI0025CDE842|nr:glycosyltransferase family 4 protein [Palaeococcus sp. (in: euryarchaeotes)]MCD6558310.1 glycosyltransferase family 4 protein [Palaeococcus sp. (in: euryarchaeotes)]
MRILMVGHYPPHGGGIANHLDSLVRELRKRHEVHILTYGTVKPRDFEKEFVHQVKIPNIFGIRGISFALLASRKIVELDDEFDFDLIHAHYVGTTSYAGVLAKKKINKPLIITAHGSDLDFMSNLPIGRYFVKKSLIEADEVISVSHYLAKKALSLGARRVRVIPNGVRPLKDSGERGEVITFIGALRRYKSPETVIMLAKEFPNERFCIVGEGDMRKELEREAPKNVEFLGYRSDVGSILSRSKLLILPSLREGFGLVILEANCLGVPVVGRGIGAIPELIRDGKNGETFKSFDDLCKKVNRLLKSVKRRRKEGVFGREVSKKYAWERSAEEVENVYRTILHSP